MERRRCEEGEAQPSGDAREAVTPPAMAKRDGDSQGLWPEPWRDAIEIPDDLGEEIVGIELFDRGLQERARPVQLRRTCRELVHGTRTELRPPPFGIQFLLGPNGVFEVVVDVECERTDRRHGYTSTERSQALRAWRLVGGA